MQSVSELVEPFKFDVFICFRGADTRYTFTADLHNALRRLFNTFKDDCEIKKGLKIEVELPKEIKGSRIFIIVLSKDFASSAFCLDEIVQILDLSDKAKGRYVLPIFFYVDPSALASTFEEALTDHKKWFTDERIQKWRNAFIQLSKIPGFRLNRDDNITENKHIENILREVSRHVTVPVGLSKRVQEVTSLWSSASVGVDIIGICGKAGMGKTTVAHGVYNDNANMESHHFDGYYLFYDVGKNSSFQLSQLKKKKVFIIFEDVEDSDQLKKIKKLTKPLGRGSKVIITSENKHLLQSCGIKSIYEVERLSETEAYDLLALKLFNSTWVESAYLDIIIRIEKFALGHPQTLELIGSILIGKSKEECVSALSKYEQMTNTDIQMILKDSFNALEEPQRKMLIHIAFFLKQLQLVQVEAKLPNDYEDCPRKHIRVLLDKSLIKVNQLGQVTLHTSTWKMVEEYGKKEIQCISNEESKNLDPMLLESQLPYQHGPSSSSQGALQ